MATSGQTLNDRINAARYALAGQGLARCVCKATTEEVIGPKKKHLDYLLACTHEPNVSIPQLANLLIERTNHIYWVVVFKALVTVHHLMSHDKTAARDFSMSTFIRRYSRYINEKALSYRLLAFDFCKVKRGNEGVLRVMPIDRLLKTLPILQNQLDALLEFDCGANDLNNGVINACFMLLFRDLIGLFACHSDGIINLLNKYFTLNRKMCREAFDLYKKFLIRVDKISEFLRVAEVVGIDRDEIPDLRRAPSSLMEALEQHLQNIESNKKILKQQQHASKSASTTGGDFNSQILGNLTPPTSRRPNSPGNLAAAAAVLNSTNTSSSTTNISSQSDTEFSISIRDEEVRKALEEEARVLSQYGTSEGSKYSASKSAKTNTSGAAREGSPKFAVTTIPKSIDDIFGDADNFGALNSNNGFSTDNGVFDNLSSSSGSSNPSSNKPKGADLDSIKSAIKSATTTLESRATNYDNFKQPSSSNKKASDELFSLLDTSATNNKQLPGTLNEPLSPFASPASPFSLPSTLASSMPQNGHQQAMPALKKGNPFPEVVNDSFAVAAMAPPTNSASVSSAFQTQFSTITPIVPVSQATLNNNNNSSVFKSGTSTANYTNLGGLEGFGELLQPMNSSNPGPNNKSSNSGSKSAFNSGSGVASTGLFKGDLDSTLANLAQNLTFEGIKPKK